MSKAISDRLQGGKDALAVANHIVRGQRAGEATWTLARSIWGCILPWSAGKDAPEASEYIEGYNEVLYFLLNSPGFPGGHIRALD